MFLKRTGLPCSHILIIATVFSLSLTSSARAQTDDVTARQEALRQEIESGIIVEPSQSGQGISRIVVNGKEFGPFYPTGTPGGPKIDHPKTLPPVLKRSMADSLNEPPDSALMQKFYSKLEAPRTKPTPAPPEKPVVRHLRSESSRIDLPSLQEIEAMHQEQEKSDQEKIQEMLSSKEYAEGEQAMMDENEADRFGEMTPPVLGSCPLDITRVVPISEDYSAKLSTDELVTSDLLILKSAPPIDIEAAFGAGVTVMHYAAAKGDYLSLVMGLEGLECLPYRIRVTDHHIVHKLGLDALKNYDANPKGELYEGVKERLSEYR